MSNTNSNYPPLYWNNYGVENDGGLQNKINNRDLPAQYQYLYDQFQKNKATAGNPNEVTSQVRAVVEADSFIRGENLVKLWNKSVDDAFKNGTFIDPVRLAIKINGGVQTGSPYLGVDAVGNLGLSVLPNYLKNQQDQSLIGHLSKYLSPKKPSDYYLDSENGITLANNTNTQENRHKSIAAALHLIARASGSEEIKINKKDLSLTVGGLKNVGFPNFGTLQDDSGQITWHPHKVNRLESPMKIGENSQSPRNESENYVAALIDGLKESGVTEDKINKFVVASGALPNEECRSIASPAKVL